MKHIKTLRIDIDKQNFKVIPSVQYDTNTRFLHIYLLNNSIALDITGCSVKISGIKPDGTAIFNNCTIINAKEGFIEVALTEQMNAAPGILKCELKLYSGSGVLTTKHFEIEVSASVTSKVVTSSNEFKALDEALSKVNNIDTKFEALTAESVMRATEKEIQKQIALGNMANLAIGENTITGNKLKNDSIEARHIQDSSIGSQHLLDDVITLSKLSSQIFEGGDDDISTNIKVPIYKYSFERSSANWQNGYVAAVWFDISSLQGNIDLDVSVDIRADNSNITKYKVMALQYANVDEIGGSGYDSGSIQYEGNSNTFSNIAVKTSIAKSNKILKILIWGIGNTTAKAETIFYKNINVKLNGVEQTVSLNNLGYYGSATTPTISKVNKDIFGKAQGKPVVASKEWVGEKIQEAIESLSEDDSPTIENRLTGKRIGVIGDSYVYGHTLGVDKTWVSKLAKRNSMTAFNYGVNGGKIAGTNGVAQRYANMESNLDYIVVFAGHNDSSISQGQVPIGTDNDSTVSTFKGALNILCRGLQTKYPKARILFMTPTHRTGAEPPYGQAMKDICYKYGIQVYDTYTKLGINIGNGTEGNAKHKEIFELVPLHLNELGNEYLSYKVEAELLTL